MKGDSNVGVEVTHDPVCVLLEETLNTVGTVLPHDRPQEHEAG